MAQKNAVYKILTPGMDAEAAGQVYIFKENRNADQKYSLESELVSNGWRYIQNDFKSYLNDTQKNTQPGENSKITIPEEEMDKLIDLCLEYAEVDHPCDKNILRNSLSRVLTWDSEYGIFSYKAPEMEGSSGLVKESIDKAFFGRVTKLSNQSDNSKYKNYQRQLFTPEPSEKSRTYILQFAYLLKMTSEDTRTYLTKWSFSDDIRWNSPWELAAAYEIECNPAREEDRASTFWDAVQQRIAINKNNPNGSENQVYLEFIHRKEQQEYDAWVKSYREHCNRNLKDAFLCHWAWLLLVSSADDAQKRIVPTLSDKEIYTYLPNNYRRLNEYVQAHVPSLEQESSEIQPDLPQEDHALQQKIIHVMKNRHLRLVAAAYMYARLNYTRKEKTIDLQYLEHSVYYTLPLRNLGFHALPTSVQKIENRHQAKKKQAPSETGPLFNQLSRSDVIRLGIELALTVEGINQLLTIGGFYKLYARDFFEYALKRTLYELESFHYTDGYRFGAKNSINARNDDDLDNARRAIKRNFLLCLEENYHQLSPKNWSDCCKYEPNWVKKGIREDGCK